MPRTLSTAALFLTCAPALAAPAPTAGRPIDLAVCLDTSNSMDGLIASAKIKLWDVVNELARVKPAPALRVALLSYGNDGYNPKAGWVRKELDLTTDLDEVYRKLNALSTHGGTEYVGRVTRDALEGLNWSGDSTAVKIVFVCGNEAANQDPEVSLGDLARLAKERGVAVNTIYCGPDGDGVSAGWRDFASLAGGKYANIDQDAGRRAVATPFDKDLAALSAKINATYCAYGAAPVRREKAANQVAQDGAAQAAAPEAAAARGVTKAGAAYRCDDWDLVDRMTNDPKFDLATLKDEELPDELRKLKPEERLDYLKKKKAERDDIRKQVADLGAKRQAYIEAELKKNPGQADKAFDAAVKRTLREQCAAKGVEIPE